MLRYYINISLITKNLNLDYTICVKIYLSGSTNTKGDT